MLSVFHYVGAGLAVVGILFLSVHYLFMSTFLDNPEMWKKGTQEAPPPEFFGMFKWFYVFFGVVLLGYCVGNLLTARFLKRRAHRTFCLVMSGLNCLHMPLGTALGVFTMIVLMRDSVRELYKVTHQHNP